MARPSALAALVGSLVVLAVPERASTGQIVHHGNKTPWRGLSVCF